MGQTQRSKGSKKQYYVVEMVEGEALPFDAKTIKKVNLPRHRKMPRPIRIAGYAAILLAILGVGGAVARDHFKGRLSDPIPATIRKSVSFPLYYSAAVPNGYKVDESSVKNVENRVTYNLVSSDGKTTVIVSQQNLPKDFDPKSMFGHTPPPSTLISLGTMYDLSYKDQYRYMITASNTLIFVGSNSKISTDQIKEITDNLKPSK